MIWYGDEKTMVPLTGGTDDGRWPEPGCYPVADGIHRIPLRLPQDGLRAVNVYVLETDAGLGLIDGGWHRLRHLSRTRRGLALSAGRRRDSRCFVTHIHRDHYTFAVELRRRHGCRVHLGADEATDSGSLTS